MGMLEVVLCTGYTIKRDTVEHDNDAIKKKIGCEWLEFVSIGDGYVLICDEEGMLNNKPQNIIQIHGDCIILKRDEKKTGELRGLTSTEQQFVIDTYIDKVTGR